MSELNAPHDRLLEQARLLLRVKRFPDAKQKLYEVLASDPFHMQALYLLATACVNSGELEEGDEVISACIQKYPEYADAFSLKAHICNQQQDFANGIKMIDEAIRLFPFNSNYFLIKASIYQRTGKVKKAIGFVDEGLQLNPGNQHLLQQKAILLHQLHDVRAEKFLSDAMMIEPEMERNFGIKGLMHLEKNELDAAESNFLEALRIEPENRDYLTGLLTIKKKKNIFYWETIRNGFPRLEIKSPYFMVLTIIGTFGFALILILVKMGFNACCWFMDVCYETAYRLKENSRRLLIRKKIIRSNIFLGMLGLSALLCIAGAQFKDQFTSHSGFFVFALIFPLISFFEDWKRKIIIREIVFSILLFGSVFIISAYHEWFYFFISGAIIIYALLWTFRAFGR